MIKGKFKYKNSGIKIDVLQFVSGTYKYHDGFGGYTEDPQMYAIVVLESGDIVEEPISEIIRYD